MCQHIIDRVENNKCSVESLIKRSTRLMRDNASPCKQRFLLNATHRAFYEELLPTRKRSSFSLPKTPQTTAEHERQKLRAHMLQHCMPDVNKLLTMCPFTALRTLFTPAIWSTAVQRRLRLPIFPASTHQHPLWCPFCLAYNLHGDSNLLKNNPNTKI